MSFEERAGNQLETHARGATPRAADPEAVRIVASVLNISGLSSDAIADGLRACGRGDDPAVWLALQGSTSAWRTCAVRAPPTRAKGT